MTGIELPEAGTYRVEVQSFAGASGGEYALAIESGAVHIAPSGEVAQALPSDGGTATVPVELNAGSSQAYVFTITEGDSLTVTTTAPELVIDIYSPSGLDIPLASGDPLLVPASDTFVMVIYARADTSGELTVNLGETVQEVVVVEQGEVAPDVSVRGTLAANEVQTYTFIPMLGGDYTVSLTSEDADKRYDPYLIVRNAAGEVIGSDDDSGGEFNALLEGLTLVGGEAITVEVHSFADQSSGDYLLVVVTDHVEQPPLIEGGELALDESATHTLELPGQQAEFTFTVAEAGLFNATLEGLKLPIVDIFDEDNTLVARGTGSIKDQMLEAGTYRVVVYDRLNRPGDFTLTMEVAE
jgi:hypothetical protein